MKCWKDEMCKIQANRVKLKGIDFLKYFITKWPLGVDLGVTVVI